MADDLHRRVLPVVRRHLSKPRMRWRLHALANWHRSYEKWFQWEVVFALEPMMRKMHGDPWAYEEWDIEHKTGGIRWDMVMLGERPLFLQFKVLSTCQGIEGPFKKGPNSMTDDIETVRRWNEGAAALLLALEHVDAVTHFVEEGIPAPEDLSPPRIELGYAPCYGCDAKRPTWARLYCWTNGL